MDDLKRIYRQALAGRILAIEAALALLDGEPGAARDASESIRRIAHSLRGSGATYGFPEVSAAAATAEDAPADALAPAVQALLAVLRTLAQEAGSARVLAVDDDPEMQLLLRVILSRPGREVEIAGTAAEAQQLLAARPFDLILLDLLLPDADGRKVLLWIRESPHNSATPVFILSAKSSSQARTECFALGADSFFEKPFDPELIASAVDGLLSRGARNEAELRAARAEARNHAFAEHLTEQAGRCREQGLPLAVMALQLPAAALAGELEPARALLDRVNGALVNLIGERAGRRGDHVFFALFPGEPAARAAVLGKRLRDELRRSLRRSRGERVPQFGAAVVESCAGEDARGVLERAEAALRAVAAGGDVVIAPAPAAGEEPVLVVEDDELVASILKHRLGRDGFRIVHRTDGIEALVDIERGGLALVILDVKLPGMDGFELLERLRRDPARSAVPVIMLTAMGSEQDIVRGLELGANDYIVKPFSPVELIARVHRLLGR